MKRRGDSFVKFLITPCADMVFAWAVLLIGVIIPAILIAMRLI